ncbi:MAG: hypothetical protein H6810_08700 [Phycisphaeraceae bacterium]|nr:MAG: hypothetical protein H6810_08700 [Phycisphaeraceae bacterium]
MHDKRPLNGNVVMLWIVGTVPLYLLLTQLLYGFIASLHVLPENGSGLTEFMGYDLDIYFCGALPIAWLVVMYLAVTGRLPGTVSKAKPTGVCIRCGYSLAGLQADRCPECGEPIQRSG